MKLYEEWQARADAAQTENEQQAYWDRYFALETENYKKILAAHDTVFSGTEKALSEEFGMDTVEFCGFVDGVNTSLKKAIDLESVTEDTEISLDVDFDKLYYNMLNAKAPWLYELTEWDGVRSAEERKAIAKKFREDHIFHSEKTVGRNEPCPCGSGKKYKNCCGKK